MTYYLTIDPGAEWAAALITAPKRVLTFSHKAPRDFYDVLGSLPLGSTRVGIEMIRSLFGKAAAANFSFARSVGKWWGILDYLDIQFEEINIHKWQAWSYNRPPRPDITGIPSAQVKKIKKEHEDNIKLLSIKAATKAFPNCDIPTHDIADAVNMARYLRFTYEGNV